MLRLLRRTAIALVVMAGGLILAALGVSAGVWIAVAGLLGAFVINLLAPWPGTMGWRDYERRSD